MHLNWLTYDKDKKEEELEKAQTARPFRRCAIVIDCGAGSVRAVGVDELGNVAGICSEPNAALPDPLFPGGMIWNTEGIIAKAKSVTRKLVSALEGCVPVAITVTSFGVDGTFVDASGDLLYPVISWQCSRSADVAARIAEFMDPGELRRINGLHPFHFNTLFKLLWFREHHPPIIEKAHAFLFMPAILLNRFCGCWITDSTMAGTSMLTSLRGRDFSEKILATAGLGSGMDRASDVGQLNSNPALSRDLFTGVFPPLVEAGTVMGNLYPRIAAEMGLPAGLPVVSAGHDTQFALFASAQGTNQPILSSGTWEILSVRTSSLPKDERSDLSLEFDALPGFYNPLAMWVASGAVEWAARTYFPHLENHPEKYSILISEASAVPPGCDGLRFIPDPSGGGSSQTGRFTRGTRNPGSVNLSPGDSRRVNEGPVTNSPGNPNHGNMGSETLSPAHHLRAVFEALSFKLAAGVKTLEKGCGFKASSVVISGGGSKNSLWNQIRADVLGIPLLVSDRAEATSLGAAMFAFAGAKVFAHPQEVLNQWKHPYTLCEPGAQSQVYRELYDEYEQQFKA
jgi:L-fuculokinase